MELEEITNRINNIRRLEELEMKPASPYDPSESMENLEEAKSYIRFLYGQLQEQKELSSLLKETLSETSTTLKDTQNLLRQKEASENRLLSNVESLMLELSESREEIRSLIALNKSLTEQLDVQRKHRFGSRSQKKNTAGTSGKDKDRTDEKEDFDGINGEKPDDNTREPSSDDRHNSGPDPFRKGSFYTRMEADEKILHRSDPGLLPEGSTYLWTETRKSFEQIVKVVEHDYEIIHYKDAAGRLSSAYLPSKDSPDYMPYIDRFPGTHASAGFLANLVFNKYVMATPFHREMTRLMTQNMSTCRQTLMNWTRKPSRYLMKVIEQFKKQALCDGSVVNVDETWHRMILRKTRKVYIWCLVNEAEKIVLFFYDKGSRSRSSLKDFLGDARLDALQSDGYNVYMYLDDDIIEADHLCCMAHARAKFLYALEQGGYVQADRMLTLISGLYDIERTVRDLPPERILSVRKEKSEKIKLRIHAELESLKSRIKVPSDNLLTKAVSYMSTFRNQLFRYLDDGRYTIDNLSAERALRPLTVDRNNSIFFCSHLGAETSVLYHTVIATCRKQGYNVLDYLKEFFRKIILGRRDYENLMPATIGIRKQIKK